MQSGQLEAGGKLVPAQLEPRHELFIFGVAAQLAHAGVVTEERIVGHASFCYAPEPDDRFVWLTHLSARRR